MGQGVESHVCFDDLVNTLQGREEGHDFRKRRIQGAWRPASSPHPQFTDRAAS